MKKRTSLLVSTITYVFPDEDLIYVLSELQFIFSVEILITCYNESLPDFSSLPYKLIFPVIPIQPWFQDLNIHSILHVYIIICSLPCVLVGTTISVPPAFLLIAEMRDSCDFSRIFLIVQVFPSILLNPNFSPIKGSQINISLIL